jgi:LmbE family N-acetylglucosaminyl deacetylase
MSVTSGVVVLAALTLVWSPALAAARQPSGAELLRALDKLGVVGHVLYVAAHPDDENTRLLAWLANEKRVRAGYLSVTRGEGGQNLIGPEQAPLLGLIRTDELLAARAIDGAEQWFTRARDFGYSKTPEETLNIWDHDAILADMVSVIRRFRPDVVVTRFPAEARETHGHHTASAQLAVEAFAAAGDRTRFASQLGGPDKIAPFRPKRIVWNRFSFGGPPTGEELAGLVKLDVGSFDPVRGESYGEMAARGRSMHKSQGFGVAPSRGESFEWFKTLAGEPMKSSIFDGVDLGWSRVPGGRKVAEHLARIRAGFAVDAPARSVPELLTLYAEMAALADHPYKREKLDELGEIILGCTGLWSDASVADYVAVPGGEVAVNVDALNRSPVAMTLREVRLPGGVRVAVDRPMVQGKPVRVEKTFKLAVETEYTQPHWLAHPPEKGHWTVSDSSLAVRPNAPALLAELVVAIGAQTLTVARPLVYKWVDPVAGERQRALEVLPAVAVNPRPSLLVFADATTSKSLTVRLKAHRAGVAGELKPELPSGWSAEPASQHFSLAQKGDELELAFRVHPPRGEAVASMRVVATVGGQKLARSVAHLEYAHIPIETVTPEAEVKLVRVDVKHKRTRIGYIPGAGDEVAAALRQIGYEVTTLTEEALAHEPLSRYQAIVTGVRAFNVDARLPYARGRLMQYVADGGTLVVQYNTNNFLSKVPTEMGPKPFRISQHRVTDETAAVELIDPAHPILTRPNRIGARDFAGWVQERGLYFADQWDAAYQPILSLHDPGESPQKGSLLVAHHGKGAFIYTGLAFFRQLPAGVPGAYRLFANLLEHGPAGAR